MTANLTAALALPRAQTTTELGHDLDRAFSYLEELITLDDAKDIEIAALKNRCSYLEDMYADLGQRVADLHRS